MNIIEETKHLGKKIRGYFCCLICTGPILAIVGISMLSMSSQTREHAVDSYNAAVDDWTNQFRLEFQNLTVSSGPNMLGVTISNSDVSFDSSGDLKTYEPLIYRGALTVGQVDGVNWEVDIVDGSKNSTFSLAGIKNSRSYTSTFDCNQSCRTVDGKKTCTTLTGCSDICAAKNGMTVSSGTNSAVCRFNVYLESVCIAVRKVSPESNWEPSSLNVETSGCYYEGESYGLNANYPGIYKSSSSSMIVLEIRHEDDPYVVASRLTSGSYNFGLRFLQKIAIGVTFLLVGGVWTLGVICLFKKIVECIQRHSSQEQKTHPENPAIAQPVSSAPYNPGPLPYNNNNNPQPQPQPYPYPPPASSMPSQYAYPYTPPAPDHVPPFGPPSTELANPYGGQVPPDHWQNNPSGYQPPPYIPAPVSYASAPSYQEPMPYGASAPPLQQPTEYQFPPLLQPQPGFGRR